MDLERKQKLDRQRLERERASLAAIVHMPFGKFLLTWGLTQAIVLFFILWLTAGASPDFVRIALLALGGGLAFALSMRLGSRWQLGRLERKASSDAT